MDADLSVAAPGAPEVDEEPGDPFGAHVDDGVFGPPIDVLPEVQESVVRGLLQTSGHLLAGSRLADEDVPDHWAFSERELDDLTPPLTRIINRRPALKRAVMRGDEAMVVVALAGYLGRNISEGRHAQEERETDGYIEREAEHDARRADATAGAAAGGPGDGGPLGGGPVAPSV